MKGVCPRCAHLYYYCRCPEKRDRGITESPTFFVVALIVVVICVALLWSGLA